MKKEAVPARTFFLLARKSPTAVIFRRGPSDWVQLVKWNTQTDEFEPGQWFRGRIYERRCDLSPNGELLVYFCSKYSRRRLEEAKQLHSDQADGRVGKQRLLKRKFCTEYTYAWTAVSRPPYLTALALWPKGDCWHGGGLFESNRRLLLNHRPIAAVPHRDHLPTHLRVEPNPAACGEDDPLFSQRLARNGWKVKQEWLVKQHRPHRFFETAQPEILEKLSPNKEHAIRLTRSFDRLDCSEEFEVSAHGKNWKTKLDAVSWAEWDHQGRLVFARDGKIIAASIAKDGLQETVLIDLTKSKPTPMPAPEWASKW